MNIYTEGKLYGGITSKNEIFNFDFNYERKDETLKENVKYKLFDNLSWEEMVLHMITKTEIIKYEDTKFI